MVLDGRALAETLKAEVRAKRAELGELTLALVVSDSNPVTDSFIRIKKRIAAELDVRVVDCKSIEEASMCDGIILQLPLPAGVDVDSERNKIPAEKDVDVLSDAAIQAGTVLAPVAAAMKYILDRHDISCQGKKVVVVGQGRLVGLPAAAMFKNLGAEVSMVGRGDDIASKTRDADIVVLGVGQPGILTPEMVKEGVVILDAGTSEAAGKVVGDADPRCAEKASLFTPVPGGIGPIAVVEIFANLVALAKHFKH